MHLFVRLFLCAVLTGALAACSSTNSPVGQSGHPDAAVDGGKKDPDAGPRPDAGGSGGSGGSSGSSGSSGRDGGNPPQAGSDEPMTPSGPTSIYPSGGSAVGKSESYRLQVVVGAPAPMNQGASENFKLRIGARLQ